MQMTGLLSLMKFERELNSFYVRVNLKGKRKSFENLMENQQTTFRHKPEAHQTSEKKVFFYNSRLLLLSFSTHQLTPFHH